MMVLQLISIIAPLFILSIVILIVIKWHTKQLTNQFKLISLKDEKKQMVTLKLQSIERLSLLLERISPESLIIREQKQSMNCQQFHALLIQTIRKEFEHNLAIQVYVNLETWQSIKSAKNEILRLINTCASESQPQNPSIELGQKILERDGGTTQVHIEKAMKSLRSEIQSAI